MSVVQRNRGNGQRSRCARSRAFRSIIIRSDPVEGLLQDPAPAVCLVRVSGVSEADMAGLCGGEPVLQQEGQLCWLTPALTPDALEKLSRDVAAAGGTLHQVLRRLEE